MRTFLFAVALTLCAVLSVGWGAAGPDESSSDVATREAVSAFHRHMERVWHRAYPARDAEAIEARVPALKQGAGDILESAKAEGSPESRSAAEKLLESVDELEAAFARGDQDAAFAAVELMHDRFHALMSSLHMGEHEVH